MSAVTPPSPPARSGPAWDIARLFPDQGAWDEADYLALNTNHLVEFSDGVVEVLPMPTMPHQLIVQYLSNLLLAFASARRLGRVLFAPLRVRLRENKYREPDIVFMLAEHASRMGRRYWDGADLVVEVVSDDPDDRERDLVVKRREYANAGIREYWIVDPRERRLTVLKLAGDGYAVHGEHAPGECASSALLAGFEVDVTALFAAAEE
jgi:Uma2 family endonuclease